MKKHQIKQGLLLCLALLIGGSALFKIVHVPKVNEPSKPIESVEQIELIQRKSEQPQNLVLGESLADISYMSDDNKPFSLSEWQGNYIVLMYWASWNHTCQETLAQLPLLQKAAESQQNVKLLLVNALDGEKETLEQAQTYLKEKQIDVPVVYDDKNQMYEKWGIKKLPTTLILSPNSQVLAIFPNKIEASSFQSMLDYVQEGYTMPTYTFLTEQMMNKEGGIYTTLQATNDPHPTNHDVLSESQGLMMEYALIQKDQDLFDQVFGYAQKYLSKDGLFLWYNAADGQPTSNAFIDDLRIYGALLQAQKQWGGYEQELAALEKALCQYNLNDQGWVDFYDFKQKKQSDTFSLCYGDLKTLETLAQRTGNETLYSQTKQQILNGYISDDFPLFYASWSYKENAYSQEPLHMGEAMVTLYHLAKANLLPKTSEMWLEEQLENKGLFAMVQIDGKVVEGSGYESTGVYALAALIGMECQNARITTLAIDRMNHLRIFDETSPYDGAFGESDGSGIYSFDQCLALKAYACLNQMVLNMR